MLTAADFYAPSMNAWHDDIDKGDPTGQSLILGSRLVPLSACTNATLRYQSAEMLASLAEITGELAVNLVVGGAVAQFDPDSTQTSITPAWRAAAWHLVIGIGWDLSTPFSTQQEAFAVVGAVWLQVFRSCLADDVVDWGAARAVPGLRRILV